MKIEKSPEATASFDPNRADQTYSQLVEVLQKNRPTVGELIVVLGNLLYTVGAGVGGYTGKAPNLEELTRSYYAEPGKIDVALMLQGLMITAWYEDYIKTLLPTEPPKS
jgi:hypothetical protein